MFQLTFISLGPQSLNNCQSTKGVCSYIQVNWSCLVLAWGDLGVRIFGSYPLTTHLFALGRTQSFCTIIYSQ